MILVPVRATRWCPERDRRARIRNCFPGLRALLDAMVPGLPATLRSPRVAAVHAALGETTAAEGGPVAVANDPEAPRERPPACK